MKVTIIGIHDLFQVPGFKPLHIPGIPASVGGCRIPLRKDTVIWPQMYTAKNFPKPFCKRYLQRDNVLKNGNYQDILGAIR